MTPPSAGGTGAPFERRGATLHFPGADVPVAVTVCSPRIVRVALGANATSETSFVAPRTWAPTPPAGGCSASPPMAG